MTFEEVEKYKVRCVISKEELDSLGLTIDDILERNEEAWKYLRELRQIAISHTDYEWPGCAYSMDMRVFPEEILSIQFSETIEDFVYGLKQSQSIISGESNLLSELINRIEASDEATARKLIKSFETNIRTIL